MKACEQRTVEDTRKTIPDKKNIETPYKAKKKEIMGTENDREGRNNGNGAVRRTKKRKYNKTRDGGARCYDF
jgi:hypothetical protein